MIIYTTRDVFSNSTDAIVNTINCEGYMGKGLAFEMRCRFPEMYRDYKNKINDSTIKIGEISVYREKNGILILNFPTKIEYKNPSKIEWIEEGLLNFLSIYKNLEINSVSFPKLGTENGHLDWKVVKDLMEKHLSNINIDVYICLNTDFEASGYERKIVEKINNFEFLEIPNLTINQKQTIRKSLPINRLKDLHKISGVGEKVYSKIYTYFLYESTNKIEQISLL